MASRWAGERLKNSAPVAFHEAVTKEINHFILVNKYS